MSVIRNKLTQYLFVHDIMCSFVKKKKEEKNQPRILHIIKITCLYFIVKTGKIWHLTQKLRTADNLL